MSYNFQKWYYTILFFLFLACVKDDVEWMTYDPLTIQTQLNIDDTDGLKINGNSITNRSNFNIKVSTAGNYTLEVLDISGIAVTRETLDLKHGNNILTFYTKAIEDGDYTINIKRDGQIIQSTKLIIL